MLKQLGKKAGIHNCSKEMLLYWTVQKRYKLPGMVHGPNPSSGGLSDTERRCITEGIRSWSAVSAPRLVANPPHRSASAPLLGTFRYKDDL